MTDKVVPPFVRAFIDEKFVARGFMKRNDDGSLQTLPKAADPKYSDEFGRLLRELKAHVRSTMTNDDVLKDGMHRKW